LSHSVTRVTMFWLPFRELDNEEFRFSARNWQSPGMVAFFTTVVL